MLISREKFAKIEEYVLYLFGIAIFLTEPCIKAMCGVVIILLFLRKILFKEKLFCGNEKLTKFLIWFLIIGVFWNFLAGMSYKPARNFIKMMRYIVLMFYVYPIVQRDRGVLKNIQISILIGYIIFLSVTFYQHFTGMYRVVGFTDFNTTGLIGSLLFQILIICNLKFEKYLNKSLVYIFSLMGFLVAIFTRGRSPVLVGGIVFILGLLMGLIYLKKKRKEILGILFLSFLVGGIGFYRIPHNMFDRFKNFTNTTENIENSSNGLRVKMWKIAVFRIKNKPIFGSGVKYDKDNLFKKYVEKMPEKTQFDKFYKRIFKNGFDDAHNIYLNTLVDHGIYIIMFMVIWFYIPVFSFLFGMKKLDENNKILVLALFTSIVSYEIQGLFWPIWRNMNQVLFWFLLSVLVSITLDEKNKE